MEVKQIRENCRDDVDLILTGSQDKKPVEKVYVKDAQLEEIHKGIINLKAYFDSQATIMDRKDQRHLDELARSRQERESMTKWLQKVMSNFIKEAKQSFDEMLASLKEKGMEEESSSSEEDVMKV
jgi:hypothetical protein